MQGPKQTTLPEQCPKCGYIDPWLAPRYRKSIDCELGVIEHLDVACNQCGYELQRPCRDDQGDFVKARPWLDSPVRTTR